MTNALPIWTLYDHPRDYPTEYVARLFIGEKPTDQVLTSKSLDLLRSEMVARGLSCLTRSPGDDPKIIETWL